MAKRDNTPPEPPRRSATHRSQPAVGAARYGSKVMASAEVNGSGRDDVSRRQRAQREPGEPQRGSREQKGSPARTRGGPVPLQRDDTFGG